MLRFVVFLAAATVIKGEEEVMKNLTTITWAHAVNNRTYLQATLASDVSMIEADIVLGQVDGKEGPPIPIMAHPPATTSDLTLADFLLTVAQYNNVNSKQKGIKLDFKSIDAFEKSQDIIAPYSKSEIIYLPVAQRHESNDYVQLKVIERNGRVTRDHGQILSFPVRGYYVGLPLTGQEVTFPLWLNADILPGPVQATTKPVDAEKFLQLAGKHPRSVLSVGWTTNFGGNITEGEYTREQIGTMIRMINEQHVKQNVTFAVRAGLASNSQPVILDLLRETSFLNSTITVWSSEGDAVAVERLRALLLTVGLERSYLDVPHDLSSRLHLPAPDVTRN